MAARRNYTQELLAKRAEGMRIVISLQPYQGVEVRYEPRNGHDPEPWAADMPYRFSGRECHAVRNESIPERDIYRVLTLMSQNEIPNAYECGQHDFGFDYTQDRLMNIIRVMGDEGLVLVEGALFSITEAGFGYLDRMHIAA